MAFYESALCPSTRDGLECFHLYSGIWDGLFWKKPWEWSIWWIDFLLVITLTNVRNDYWVNSQMLCVQLFQLVSTFHVGIKNAGFIEVDWSAYPYGGRRRADKANAADYSNVSAGFQDLLVSWSDSPLALAIGLAITVFFVIKGIKENYLIHPYDNSPGIVFGIVDLQWLTFLAPIREQISCQWSWKIFESHLVQKD